MTTHEAKARGFDLSRRTPPTLHIACSQCEALVVNGVPTHERGCSNAGDECAGCNARVPHGVRYCADCR